jgi:hypothetical protein
MPGAIERRARRPDKGREQDKMIRSYLPTAETALPVLYQEYAEVIAGEALRGQCACQWCQGTGRKQARIDDLAPLCGGCGGSGCEPSDICNRCGESVYSEQLDMDGCCETCPPCPVDVDQTNGGR